MMTRLLRIPTTCHRKNLLVALVSAFLLFSLLSAFGSNPIELSLDRPHGRYAHEETAVISVVVAPEVLEARAWKGSVSWQRNWSGEITTRDWSPDEASIRFPLDDEKPGQIVFTVALVAEDDATINHREMIGLLYLPEMIELSTPEPRDFDAFWEKQKKDWRSLNQEVVLTPVESPQEGVMCWDLTIKLEGETPVSGYLAIPQDATANSLPALLDVHGAGVRSSNLGAPARAARGGFIALDINAHGLPNGLPDDFYQEKNNGELRGYRQEGVESREDWYFRAMYLRVLTALDYLCSRSEWNGYDLVVRGSSQGGGQALAGAGLDSRVTVVAASVPALCDLTGEPMARKPGWPQPAGSENVTASRRSQILKTVGYFDVGLFARRIEAPVILSLGLADPVCPAVGIQATMNNLAGPARAIYRPAMGHAFPQDIREAFEEFILERVTLPLDQ